MFILNYSQSFLWHSVANRAYYDIDMNYFSTEYPHFLYAYRGMFKIEIAPYWNRASSYPVFWYQDNGIIFG